MIMGPKRKNANLIEKSAVSWDWALDACAAKLTDDQIAQAYHLHLPVCVAGVCKKNCKLNPFCVNGLGAENLAKLYSEKNKELEQQLKLMNRLTGVPAGLRNLGATCYINSFLQLWFHNLSFRKAVYEFNVGDLVAANEKMRMIQELQRIFALLQLSDAKFVDPRQFVDALGVDSGEQQDAQEFCKLFLSMVEGAFAEHASKTLRGAVNQLFEGRFDYLTTCSVCKRDSTRPSTFLELALQIKELTTLSDCIDAFVKEEDLVADNQYFCSYCNQLRDATRSIKLRKLPPTLNFQLLRFVYNRKTLQKQKLLTPIYFPDILDMSSYVGSASQSVIYELSAILIHHGASANSGHYFALIRESDSRNWFQYNDELVQAVKTPSALTAEVEKDIANGSPAARKKIKKIPNMQCSRGAYMLVYQLVVDPSADANCVASPSRGASNANSVTVPNVLLSSPSSQRLKAFEFGSNMRTPQTAKKTRGLRPVDDLGGTSPTMANGLLGVGDVKSVEKEAESVPCKKPRLIPENVETPLRAGASAGFGTPKREPLANGFSTAAEIPDHIHALVATDLAEEKPKFEAERKELQREINSLAQRHLDVEAVWTMMPVTSKTENFRWCPKDQLVDFFSSTDSDEYDDELDWKPYLCCHGKLDFERIADVKCVSEQAYASLATSDQLLTRASLCRDCVSLKCAQIKCKMQATEVQKAIVQRLRNFKPEKEPDRPCVWVGRESFNKWVKLAQAAVTAQQAKDARVETEEADSDEVSDDGARNSPDSNEDELDAALEKIIEDEPNGLGEMEKDDDELMLAGDPGERASPVDGDSASKVVSAILERVGINGTGAAISPEPTTTDSQLPETSAAADARAEANVPPPDEPATAVMMFNDDVVCQHGKLMTGSGKRLIPTEVFEEICGFFPKGSPIRRFDRSVSECEECQKCEDATDEISRQQKDIAVKWKASLPDLFALKNRPGFEANEVYVLCYEYYALWKQFIKDPTKQELPLLICNKCLICEHGLVLPHHSVILANDDSIKEKCIAISKVEWDSLHQVESLGHDCEIILRRGADDMVSDPAYCETCGPEWSSNLHDEEFRYGSSTLTVVLLEADVPIPTGNNAEPPQNDVLPPRRSMRQPKPRGGLKMQYRVNSDMTVQDVKVKCINRAGALPSDMRLFFNGKELTERDRTLQALHIPKSTTLHLKIDSTSEEGISDDVNGNTKKRALPEQGFLGTNLLGN